MNDIIEQRQPINFYLILRIRTKASSIVEDMKITSMSHRTIELNCSKYFNLIVALACVTRRFANSTVWFSIEGNRAGVSTSGRCSWWNLRARAIVPMTVRRAKRVPRDGSSPSLKKLLFKPCMCAYARACMKHGQGA